MAQNNFKIFDQNKVNMQSDTDYTNNNQRLNGVQQGIASSSLNNKALYQASTMNAAIAGFMNDNGQDATDTNLLTLKNNYSATLTNFSNGVNSVIESYPVKSGVTFSAGYPVDIESGEITITKSTTEGLVVLNNQTMDAVYQADATHLYTAKGTTVYQFTLTDGTFQQTASYTYSSAYDNAKIVSFCKYSNTVLFATLYTHSNTSNTINYNNVLALNIETANTISYISESEEISSISSGGFFKMQPFVGGTVMLYQPNIGTATDIHVMTYIDNTPSTLSTGIGSYPVLLNNNTVLASAVESTTTTVRIIFHFYAVSSTGELTIAKYSNDGTVRETDFENIISTADDKLAVVSGNSSRLGNIYTVNYTDYTLTTGATIAADPLLYEYISCYPTNTRKVTYRASTSQPYSLHKMTFSAGVTYEDEIKTNFTNIAPYTYYAGISKPYIFNADNIAYALYEYKPGSSSEALGFAQTGTLSASIAKDAIAMQDSTTSPCKVCFAGAVKIDGINAGISVVTPGVSMQTYSDNRCIIYNSNAIPYQVLSFTGDGSGQRSLNVGFVYKFIIEADTSKIVLGNSTMLYVPTNNVNGTTYTYIAFR